MLDRDNSRHPVPDVRAGKIGILVLQNSKLPCVLVHHCRKGGLKACQMSSSFCIIDIVAESKNVFVELIDILENRLHLDALGLSFEVDRVVNRLALGIQILDKPDQSIRLMVGNLLFRFFSLICKMNRQFRIQICSFVKSALDFLLPESCLFKNLAVREKINGRPCLFRLSDHRKEPVFQFHHRNSPLISVMVNDPVTADLHIHIFGKGIDYGRAHTMEPAACLVDRIVKLSSCVQCCIDNTRRRYAFLMHSNRHAAPVIGDCRGAVFFQRHFYIHAKSGQMFIHGIVHDLVYQMIQPLCTYTSDIHAGTLPDCLQTFQYRDTVRIVCRMFRHRILPFFLLIIRIFQKIHYFQQFTTIEHTIQEIKFYPFSTRFKDSASGSMAFFISCTVFVWAPASTRSIFGTSCML